MTIVDTFVDAEALVGSIIRLANVSGLNGVYSSLPKTPDWPIATVTRIGGIPAERHRVDRARIQIDVWGGSKSEAFDIIADIRTVLFAAEGQSFDLGTYAADAFISGVEDDLGFSFQPDPKTARDRYVYGVAVTLHSLPGGS